MKKISFSTIKEKWKLNNQFQESTKCFRTRFATRTFSISSREEGRLQLKQVAEKDQENSLLFDISSSQKKILFYLK